MSQPTQPKQPTPARNDEPTETIQTTELENVIGGCCCCGGACPDMQPRGGFTFSAQMSQG